MDRRERVGDAKLGVMDRVCETTFRSLRAPMSQLFALASPCVAYNTGQDGNLADRRSASPGQDKAAHGGRSHCYSWNHMRTYSSPRSKLSKDARLQHHQNAIHDVIVRKHPTHLPRVLFTSNETLVHFCLWHISISIPPAAWPFRRVSTCQFQFHRLLQDVASSCKCRGLQVFLVKTQFVLLVTVSAQDQKHTRPTSLASCPFCRNPGIHKGQG